MTKSKNCLAVIVALPAALLVAESKAAPFQLTAVASIAQSDTTFPITGSEDTDVLGLSAVYYLRPVDTTIGPLFERPFLDKSAFLMGAFTQNKVDAGQDRDVLGLEARFVTQDDMIFELGYQKTDVGIGSDSKILDFGVGKYLDGSTTAIFYYETQDNGIDVDTIGGRYKRLLNESSSGTYVTYEIGLAYVDSSNDSGFEFDLDGTYYLSKDLSVGAGLRYLDVGDSDETELLIAGTNFFTETLFANVFYRKTSRSSNIDTDLIGAQLGARF